MSSLPHSGGRSAHARAWFGYARAWLANRWRTGPILAAPFGLPTAMPIERRPLSAAGRPRRVSPRQRATHAPPFFPTTRRAGDLSSYKFLLSLSRFPAAAPHRPPLRAVGHRSQRAPGRFAPHSLPLRGDEAHRFLFCCIKVCPASPRCPPPSGHRPRALHPAALGGRHSPLTHRRAVPGIPAVRRWVIIHSLPHFPIARAPRL